MAVLIKIISGKHLIEFDKGLFDNWCVYLKRQGSLRYAPRDVEYFSILKRFGEKYKSEAIYADFVKCYHLTTKRIENSVLKIITEIAGVYKTDAEEIDIWYTVIYAGMVAEENKAYAKLRKRIKRLGMYQLLMEGFDSVYAANFSKGKNWHYLDELMKQRGF